MESSTSLPSSPAFNRPMKRPSFIKHLPPLDSPQPAFSDRPKILQTGTRTTAAPVKEEKHFRHVSDSIANNYSPTARDLTTSLIYDRLKLEPEQQLREYEKQHPASKRSFVDVNLQEGPGKNTKNNRQISNGIFTSPTPAKKQLLRHRSAYVPSHVATHGSVATYDLQGHPNRIQYERAFSPSSQIHLRSPYFPESGKPSKMLHFDLDGNDRNKTNHNTKQDWDGKLSTFSEDYDGQSWSHDILPDVREGSRTAMYHAGKNYVRSGSAHPRGVTSALDSTTSISTLEERFFSLSPSAKRERTRFRSGRSSVMNLRDISPIDLAEHTRGPHRSHYKNRKISASASNSPYLQNGHTSPASTRRKKGDLNGQTTTTSGVMTQEDRDISSASDIYCTDESFSTHSLDKNETELEDCDGRAHDEATQAALDVVFPPYTHSTQGLSRPSTPEEKELPMYYKFMKNSIDSGMIAHLSTEWKQKIQNKVYPKLIENWPEVYADITQEIGDIFRESQKKAVLDYILLDPNEQIRLGILLQPKSSSSAGRVRYPWYESLRQAKQNMIAFLHINHPVCAAILTNWHDRYRTFRLIDIPKIYEMMPLDLENLVEEVTRSSIMGSQYLAQQWVTECSNIAEQYKAEIEEISDKQSEEISRSDALNRFFNCVGCLMSNLLREAVKISIHDFVYLMEIYSAGNRYESSYAASGLEYPTKPRPLRIYMVPDTKGVVTTFSPDFNGIIAHLHEAVDIIVESVQKLLRIEHKLFQAVDGNPETYLSTVKVDDEIVIAAKQRISAVVLNNSHGPTRYRTTYEPIYHYLLNENTDKKVKNFLGKEPTLRSYRKELEKLLSMSRSISVLPVYIPMNLFLIDCVGLNQWLSDRSAMLHKLMVDHVEGISRFYNREICTEYDQIVGKITSHVELTSDLVELQEYLEGLPSGQLLKLRDMLELAAKNLMFLMEYSDLSHSDVLLNSNTFSWPDRIIPIIRTSEKRLQKEHDMKINRLKSRQRTLEKRLEETESALKEFQKKEKMAEAQRYLDTLNEIQSTINGFMEEKQQVNREEVLLSTGQVTQYPQIQELLSRKEPFDKLWRTAVDFYSKYDQWMNGPLLKVNAEIVEEEVQRLWKTSYKLSRRFQHPDLLGPLKAAATIKTKLEKFRLNMPVISALCNPGIKTRHWDLMSEQAGFSITPKEDTALSGMLGMGLEKHLENLTHISNQARKEYALEKALTKMKEDWKNVDFGLVPYRDLDISVLSAVEDIQLLLDDHVVKTHTMKGSPFIEPFRQEIQEWEEKLERARSIIESWLVVQAAWLYLEPIFGSEDIRHQIPLQGKLFTQVDAKYKNIMARASTNPNVMVVLNHPSMLEDLKESEALLEDIQKGLNLYLEKKRLFFPRFFFLSNDELLEILSETKDPLRVQPHLKKCFEGIARLAFTKDKNIIAMQSAEDEQVDFVTEIRPSDAGGLVERWLWEVEKSMKGSIKDVTEKAIKAYTGTPFRKWCLQWPGQVILAVSNVYWTSEVTQAIGTKNGLQEYLKVCDSHIDDIIHLVRGKLTTMARVTLGALVTIDVHARDVVSQLDDKGVSDVRDFQWISQMRYYWEERMINVRMISTTVTYGYEYLGNTTRLVITPLTERCYRTLMGALQLNLGGAPEGPAGTGKTETCKDLAKAVAKQCVVFNCSDGLDYKAMGKFFKGLAQSGAWACFDEFNRIDLEVLSVVAQQIQTIQRAVADQAKTFVFEGTEISLDPSCTIFITMNPGYAGRAELPDNLKVLFRTVAMMIPDYALIAEISLYSMGFVQARSLAVKIAATYRLCSEQLSSQHHYDYGMRAVKSVLTAAGNLKLKFPEQPEDELMLRAVTDVNLPKFLSHDIPLFQGIISDLFPGVSLPQPDHGVLEKAILSNIARMQLQPVPWFIDKIIQLYEMLMVRHGFMIVGEAVGGKTRAYNILAAALGEISVLEEMQENAVRYRVINPKAVTMAQLYGSFDLVSHEWSDGILANTFREHATSTSNERKWLIFDGPVDAVWVENLNTVLDDNRKLCLMSGEIIAMNNKQNIIFEVQDLEQASPATVSRCGMVYMDPKELGTEVLITSWLQTSLPEVLTKQQKDSLRLLFQWLVPPCIQYVQKHCHNIVPVSEMHLTLNLLKLYDCMLKEITDDIGPGGGSDGESITTSITDDTQISNKLSASNLKAIEERGNMLIAHFLFATIWSIAGVIEEDSRDRFNDFFREMFEQNPIKGIHAPPKELKIPRNLLIPKRGSVFDYVYVKKTYGSWHRWANLTKTPDLSDDTKLSNVIIDTVDTYRQTYFLRKFVASGKPLLLVGPTGTGKTAITNSFLRELPKNEFVITNVSFSAKTSATQTQDMIFSKLDRRRRGVYGPTPGRRMIVFVDDLNMPAKEKYGAQPPIELLRQWIDHGYWFDKKDTSMLHLVDVSMVGAMAPPGGGRNDITPRLIRHFNVITIHAFNDETMKTIFQPMIDWHFSRGFDNSLRRFGRIIIWATTDVYTHAISKFLPTPSKSHYVFNLRDYARVIQGVLLFRSECCPSGTEGALKMARVWIHEVYRVFYDRLVDDDDRHTFFGIVKTAATIHFKEKMTNIFQHMVADQSGRKEVSDRNMRRLFFGDYMSPKMEDVVAERLYDEIVDLEEMRVAIEKYLEDYNTISKAPMDLVLFQFAIEHISRISRILKQPSGHALLVGIGGSGRQSSARVAAFMGDYEVFSVNVTKSYSVHDWRSDLKTVMRRSGEDLVPTVFLFGDHQIKDESFLEDINMLLNSGDIPNIFDNEERLEIIDKMQQLAQTENTAKIEINPLNMYNLFIEGIRRNLHIVLAFSPVGDAFRTRLRNYPSLINCCTIDWFQAWPEDALEMVANTFLDEVEMSNDIRQQTVIMCKKFHQSVRLLSEKFYESLRRRTYITPTSYLELIKTFKNLLQRNRLDLLAFKNRYVVGLEKLEFAQSQIGIMQEELTALQPQLEQSSKEVEELVSQISAESAEVEVVKQNVEADEAVAAKAAEEARKIKQECEEKLAVAMPALNAAVSALNTLRQQDIALVKTMTNPPAGVKLTMEAICVLKGIKPDHKTDGMGRAYDDYWPAARKMLGDMKLLDSLREFDKDNIPTPVMKKIRERFIEDPNFRPELIKNVSSACEGLCSWVRAVEVYDRVAKVVAPKRKSLEAAESELEVQMTALEKKRAELQSVREELEVLNQNLLEKLAEKESLENNIELTKVKLVRAEKLISGLGGEKTRWTEMTHSLESTYFNIVGDVLLSSGIVAYLAPFTPKYRQDIVNNWLEDCRNHDIPVSNDFTLSKTLGDPVKILDWQLAGLPKDDFSVDNSIIVMNANRWPLMIDPQGQASKWIKNMEKPNNLKVCKLTDDDYARTLENCIQFGNPILIENVHEQLDPLLEPLLLHQTFKQNGMEYVKLGEATIQYSHDFKLYISTRLRNPHYMPEVSVKVTLLNFMITPRGLEDQLLRLVAAKEKPELEEKKNVLILEGAKNKRQLKDIEDKILEVLSSAQGNILEDETAISILSSSRKLSEEITEKQKITSKTETEIDFTRNGYRPVASHSSILFFVISDLANIDPMYQYSLNWFINLYLNSIENSRPSQDLQQRINYLKDHFTQQIYRNVCRSLFEKDKLLFSFLLCIGIARGRNEINDAEWKFLLTGGVALDNPFPNPASAWLTDKSWAELVRCSDLQEFSGLMNHVRANVDKWQALHDSNTPHSHEFPGEWNELNKLQKLVIVRCLRPDKVVPAVQDYIVSEMGAQYIEPPTFDLDGSYLDSDASTPLIFILSPGADPMASLVKFAEEKGIIEPIGSTHASSTPITPKTPTSRRSSMRPSFPALVEEVTESLKDYKTDDDKSGKADFSNIVEETENNIVNGTFTNVTENGYAKNREVFNVDNTTLDTSPDVKDAYLCPPGRNKNIDCDIFDIKSETSKQDYDIQNEYHGIKIIETACHSETGGKHTEEQISLKTNITNTNINDTDHVMNDVSPKSTMVTRKKKLLKIKIIDPDQNQIGNESKTQSVSDMAELEQEPGDFKHGQENSLPEDLNFDNDSNEGIVYRMFSGMQTISLGQGQGPIAAKMIEYARMHGTWVVLQNCHLATSWLPELRRICEEVITDHATTKPEFRLWLTSYPSPKFPVPVLQNSVKMTNEPPKGLRANLLRSYRNDPVSDPLFFHGCRAEKEWKPLLLSLCFFHAIVQERRKFGALGWNIPYEFNESDLRISVRQTQMFLNDYNEVPFVALNYLIGECNYGGRVTDNRDRRLLKSLLETFLCKEVIENSEYKFSPSGLYYAPTFTKHREYLEFIKQLPINTHPEMFGLHENADISKDQQETQQMFDGILLTLPRQNEGTTATQNLVEDLASDILSKLPTDFDTEEVKKKYPTDYSESMNTVLAQELIRFNNLTQVVRNSLQELKRALRGLVLMSAELEDVLDSMLVGKVPILWAAKSYPSLKPLGSYITDLIARLQFFRSWMNGGKPDVFWISGFFFTQSFLTGILQNYARENRISIDKLDFRFEVLSNENDSEKASGVRVNGLYMEGARWCRKEQTITDSKKKILYDVLPTILLQPRRIEEINSSVDSEYDCPVYKTSARRGLLSTTGHSTNYVLTIKFPTKVPTKHWVNRGVACLCQLDD
uniref:dynein heavy chain 3, axonemal-like n=1 Tax=Styela clava TaxID=7725 RepID=UPI00193AD1D7|nr:dynein heavy chain 3, axonemal-like [Styela clava]